MFRGLSVHQSTASANVRRSQPFTFTDGAGLKRSEGVEIVGIEYVILHKAFVSETDMTVVAGGADPGDSAPAHEDSQVVVWRLSNW